MLKNISHLLKPNNDNSKNRLTLAVEIHAITADRNDTEFLEGYAWDTDAKTWTAFHDAKATYECSFENAAHLIDLKTDHCDQILDTFPISAAAYADLTRIKPRRAG